MITKILTKLNYLAKNKDARFYKIKNLLTISLLVKDVFFLQKWIIFQTQNVEYKMNNINALRTNPSKWKGTFFYYDLLEISNVHIPIPLVPNFILTSSKLKLEFDDNYFYGGE